MVTLIDGKKLRDKILEDLKSKVEKLSEKPCLAVVIVGQDPASKIYVSTKGKTAESLGYKSITIEMPAETSQESLLNKIEELNNDVSVNAILVQLPLPKHIDSEKVIEAINLKKDVDCFHPCNAGKVSTNSNPYVYPCTPLGVVKLLQEYNIPIEGQNVVIVGRSNIVGKPLAQMLINMSATVTVCHSRTKNLPEVTKSADILISAVGKAGFITKEMVKDGAVVIDVGTNRIETLDGCKLVGDVNFEEVKDKASYITPVPGGVGPMTICCLMTNTYDLFKLQKIV